MSNDTMLCHESLVQPQTATGHRFEPFVVDSSRFVALLHLIGFPLIANAPEIPLTTLIICI